MARVFLLKVVLCSFLVEEVVLFERVSGVTAPLVFSQVLGVAVQVGEGVRPLLLDFMVFTTPLCCLSVLNRVIFRQCLLKTRSFVRNPNVTF